MFCVAPIVCIGFMFSPCFFKSCYVFSSLETFCNDREGFACLDLVCACACPLFCLSLPLGGAIGWSGRRLLHSLLVICFI